MNEEFNKPYNPKAVEEKIYKKWEDSGYFSPDNLPANKLTKLKAKSYCVCLPPPNVTGNLHMGHALNSTIQDILIRYKRMKGFKVLWIPGTDHAGIATQNVVEKQLHAIGKRKEDFTRDELLKMIWDWKDEKGGEIISQLQALGCACDWDREQFTMSPKLSSNVQKTFKHLFENGFIYTK